MRAKKNSKAGCCIFLFEKSEKDFARCMFGNRLKSVSLRGREGKAVEEEDEAEYFSSADHGGNETPGWRFGSKMESSCRSILQGRGNITRLKH